MRIALVAPLVSAIREPQRGGSQAFLSDLARGLVRRGHEVHVYAAAGSDIPDVTVIDTGIDPRSLAATLYRASGAAAREECGPAAGEVRGESAAGQVHGPAADPAAAAFASVYAQIRDAGSDRGSDADYDVVHNHAFDAPAITLAAGLGARVVHTLHLPPDRRVAEALRAATAQEQSPTVAAVSEFQAAAWRQIVRVDAILPPLVPTRSIPWSQSAGDGALFAGRLSPEKGAAEAIDIARAAGVPISIYGDPYDVDYARTEIGQREAQPGVDVHRAVPRSSLWAAMARAAVLLFPALWDEPFGMAAAEAQACGTPVVGFRRGALGEVISDGLTGYLVPPGDIEAAAEAVRRTAEISRSRCRAHAEAHLDLERTLDAHELLYRQVASVSSGVDAGG